MTGSIDKLLFAAAADLEDSEERRLFLDHACGDDLALRRRLEALLEIRRDAEIFFRIPRATAEISHSNYMLERGKELGAWIGRYQLLERLGAGGYGVVYLAEQHEPVHRKVALKIIRMGMDTDRVIARFEAERQALASMDHPNITKVLDAGAAASGRPYFVMELVDGVKITDFCDGNLLGIPQRLRLFVQVCLAIQHAHQKGVIHRDIKPSNVLVRQHDGVPIPKVIDFGIAMATYGGGLEDETFKGFDQFLGTPAYMSPEQTAGEGDIDTRSDVYSLGVLLYELLSGRLPYEPEELKHLNSDEIRRTLQETEPLVPSMALKATNAGSLAEISARRRADPNRIISILRGDLDWIVSKAMGKDRADRYDTANGLARDVLRYLNNEPVSARPTSRIYRLRKLFRRNKMIFAAGGIAVVGLLAGLGVSTWMLLREVDARKEQARLRAIAEVATMNEVELRRAAEFRERVAQAAVNIGYGNLEEADRLLASVPVDDMPPSLEAVRSLLRVAQWHLQQDRWGVAAARFVALATAMSKVDASDNNRVSFELLPAAAVVRYAGDIGLYEQLQNTLMTRFAGTLNPVVAEHVLKSCLLMPVDEDKLRRLEPFEKILSDTLNSKESEIAVDSHKAAWSCFALSLIRYRAGDDTAAAIWALRCLAYPGRNAPRIASAKSVLAMVEMREGHPEHARAICAEAGELVNHRFEGKISLEKFEGDIDGHWFDWINALILFEEADRNTVAE